MDGTHDGLVYEKRADVSLLASADRQVDSRDCTSGELYIGSSRIIPMRLSLLSLGCATGCQVFLFRCGAGMWRLLLEGTVRRGVRALGRDTRLCNGLPETSRNCLCNLGWS